MPSPVSKDWSVTACSPALFPETAAALHANRSGALRRMLLAGLRGTDARVAKDEPVSPAFLFALLLWPAYCRALAQLQHGGMHAAEAERRAADRVTVHQLNTIALPRRFSLPMQEIWLLQSRFSQRQRKRVFRLLAHPRFRAAFDFLSRAPGRVERARRRRRLLARSAATSPVMCWPRSWMRNRAANDSTGAARRRRRRRRGGSAAPPSEHRNRSRSWASAAISATPRPPLRHAFRDLDALPHTRLLRASSSIARRPGARTDQPDFINAVAMLETALAARELLDAHAGHRA